MDSGCFYVEQRKPPHCGTAPSDGKMTNDILWGGQLSSLAFAVIVIAAWTPTPPTNTAAVGSAFVVCLVGGIGGKVIFDNQVYHCHRQGFWCWWGSTFVCFVRIFQIPTAGIKNVVCKIESCHCEKCIVCLLTVLSKIGHDNFGPLAMPLDWDSYIEAMRYVKERVPSFGFGLGVGFLRGNQYSGLTRLIAKKTWDNRSKPNDLNRSRSRSKTDESTLKVCGS